MPHSGDEPDARCIGAFCTSQRVLQFQRAFDDAGFQRFIGLPDRAHRVALFGDVVDGHHEATIGNFLRKD